VVVVGAGPAGLTAGYLLARAGQPVIVLEATDQVGGLARTEVRDGYRFDLGGHRFFTKSRQVEELWLEILGEEFLLRPRMSRIFWNGRFLHYPLQVRDVIRKLGPVELARSAGSYLWAVMTPNGREESFEHWVCNRFGRRLFELFFRSYTEKVWGVSTSELRAEWAAQRIKGLSFFTAARSALLGHRGPQVKSLISEFHYPRYGPGQMWEAMRDAIVAAGGTVRLNAPMDRLEIEDGRAVAVHARGERIACADVISSVPLRAVVGMASPQAPEHVREAARGLRYRDFVTVALVLDGEDLFPDNWIYIHEPAVRVGRIQNYRSWSPWMVPDPSTACVGLEYFCFQGDDLWESSDEELVALATRELEQLGLADRAAVARGYVTRVPLAYPMYDADYARRIEVIRSWLQSIGNLQQVGRNGLHRYNNSDHSMLTALRAVDNLLSGAAHDLWEVNVESSYQEEDVAEQQPYRSAPDTRAMSEPLVHVFRPQDGIGTTSEAPPAGPTCSIVVPATNGPVTLTRCLAGVRAGIGDEDEVLVIDDVPLHSPARIRNEGAIRARGDILIFVDADVIPHPDAVGRFREAFARDPGLSAVIGSYDDEPPSGVVSEFRNLLHHHVHQESDPDVQTFWAGLGAVRREVFLAAGGFDHVRFPRPMLEDVEFGLRLSEAGHRIALLPEAQGRHLKRWTLRSMLMADFRNRGIPWTRLLIERRRVPATLNLGWRHRLSAATVVATAALLVATRRPAVLVVGVGNLLVLNRRFYRLLARHGGVKLAGAGVALHALHHATAVAALPFGALAHVRRGGATPVPRPLQALAIDHVAVPPERR
jgi:protoporphyrinogen oxidase